MKWSRDIKLRFGLVHTKQNPNQKFIIFSRDLFWYSRRRYFIIVVRDVCGKYLLNDSLAKTNNIIVMTIISDRNNLEIFL